jgi:hypothetical protein
MKLEENFLIAGPFELSTVPTYCMKNPASDLFVSNTV